MGECSVLNSNAGFLLAKSVCVSVGVKWVGDHLACRECVPSPHHIQYNLKHTYFTGINLWQNLNHFCAHISYRIFFVFPKISAVSYQLLKYRLAWADMLWYGVMWFLTNSMKCGYQRSAPDLANISGLCQEMQLAETFWSMITINIFPTVIFFAFFNSTALLSYGLLGTYVP